MRDIFDINVENGDPKFAAVKTALLETAKTTPDFHKNDKNLRSYNLEHEAFTRLGDSYLEKVLAEDRELRQTYIVWDSDSIPLHGSDKIVSDFLEPDEILGAPDYPLGPRAHEGVLQNFFALKSYQPGKIMPINFFNINGIKLTQSGYISEAAQRGFFAALYDSGYSSILNMADRVTDSRPRNRLNLDESVRFNNHIGQAIEVKCVKINTPEENEEIFGPIDYPKANIRKYEITNLSTGEKRSVEYVGLDTSDHQNPTRDEMQEKNRLITSMINYLSKVNALENGCMTNCSEGMNRSASGNLSIAYFTLVKQKLDEICAGKSPEEQRLIVRAFQEHLNSPIMRGGEYTHSDMLIDQIRLAIEGRVIKGTQGRAQNHSFGRACSQDLIQRKLAEIDEIAHGRDHAVGAGAGAGASATVAAEETGRYAGGGEGAAAGAGAGAGAGSGVVGATERTSTPTVAAGGTLSSIDYATFQERIHDLKNKNLLIDHIKAISNLEDFKTTFSYSISANLIEEEHINELSKSFAGKSDFLQGMHDVQKDKEKSNLKNQFYESCYNAAATLDARENFKSFADKVKESFEKRKLTLPQIEGVLNEVITLPFLNEIFVEPGEKSLIPKIQNLVKFLILEIKEISTMNKFANFASETHSDHALSSGAAERSESRQPSPKGR